MIIMSDNILVCTTEYYPHSCNCKCNMQYKMNSKKEYIMLLVS